MLPIMLAAPARATTVSSGIDDFGCRPSPAHPRPLVLIHATFTDPLVNWLIAGPYFAERGYCVFELDYGQTGLPLVHGIGPIEDSARQLSAYVDRVLAATGARQVDLLGHSQGGGVLPRYYLKYLGGAAKVHRLVGLAPSNHGGTALGAFTLVQEVPLAEALVGTACPACVEQFVGSNFDTAVDAGGDTVPGVEYTVIASSLDEVMTPHWNSFLTGPQVHNVVLQDLCPLDLSEHVLTGMIDPIALHEAANALDPEHATPTDCGSVIP
jgi:pimeloyl-ACP methyl ester carboxylesterase